MYTQQEIQAAYARWCAQPLPDALKQELLSIADDAEAIKDRFYRDLEFGTGGLRGLLGAGANRMNICTVARATQGFANDLKAQGGAPSVCISYDSRINSDVFARTAACVFAANGVQVYLWQELMPTPALSFSVRYFHAQGGVMVTASHNPAAYNGYKVYGPDGCQLTLEASERVLSEIEAIDIFNDVKTADFDACLKNGSIRYIGEEVFEAYMQAVSAQGVNLSHIDKNVALTYTPLNGAGRRCVTTVLARNGFTNVSLVPTQAEPDGNFPTCPYPNPEIRQALEEGLKAARENGSDLLIATDPDCDRMGVAVRDGEDFTLITGNQMGVLLLDYICAQRIARGTMPARPIAIKTIVTTEMAAKVAASYGVELLDVLTGFKFIGEQILLLEQRGEEERYIFGFEESYGYLSGAYVRDKDAVDASLLCAEMFAYYKGQGKTLMDVLNELYSKHGYFLNALDNFAFEGADGFAAMQRIMAALRAQAPDLGLPLLSRADYKSGTVTLADGTTQPTGLPLSDVLRFNYADDVCVVVRPSGTEPKLKAYYSIKAAGAAEAEALSKSIRANVKALIESSAR